MIAATILQQLGGRRFLYITGCKDPVNMGNGLRLKLARNRTLANRLDIIYDAGKDLYVMRFWRLTFSKKTLEVRVTEVRKYEEVYYDMLTSVFTDVTGLVTRL